MMSNCIERSRAVVYRIILIMATKLDTQHFMLLLKWFVPSEVVDLSRHDRNKLKFRLTLLLGRFVMAASIIMENQIQLKSQKVLFLL